MLGPKNKSLLPRVCDQLCFHQTYCKQTKFRHNIEANKVLCMLCTYVGMSLLAHTVRYHVMKALGTKENVLTSSCPYTEAALQSECSG